MFILGMIAQSHLLSYDLSKLAIYSKTLQAIAAGYLIGSIIMYDFRRIGLLEDWRIASVPGTVLFKG